MSTFTIYIKRKGGEMEAANKAANLLKTYLSSITNTTITGTDVKVVDDGTSPTLLDTDVIVYMVRSVSKSVIAKQGGSVAIAEANEGILGLTDLNKKICEVYFARMYEGSPKELSGAVYHEAAHILSNMDNSMHKNQDGFLKDAPDYNGSPTTKNQDFMKKHVGKAVKMNGTY